MKRLKISPVDAGSQGQGSGRTRVLGAQAGGVELSLLRRSSGGRRRGTGSSERLIAEFEEFQEAPYGPRDEETMLAEAKFQERLRRRLWGLYSLTWLRRKTLIH